MAAIVVPRLGWNMEEGVFMGWLKRDGEFVRAGEPLFTLEGDKAAQEIEALESGVLRIAAGGPKDGDTVAVGAVLGFLEAADKEAPVGARPRQPATPIEKKMEIPPQPSAITAVVPSPSTRSRQVISPRARRAARERSIDTSQLQGTGKNGRIRECDIVAAAGSASHLRITPLRRTIAERMVHNMRTTAPVTLTTTADATNLVKFRNQRKTAAHESDAVVPSYTDIFVMLAALALKRHPALNARWEIERIVTVADIHIGVAVDTEAGLLVPVVRHVLSLTLQQIAQQTRNLAEKARRRQLSSDEMQGGTFTITNLGAYGIDAFTPIINWPQCAILGIGRIRRQPAVVNDQIVPCDQVTLSLTFDHRLVDGAPAALFLQTLCSEVESPTKALQ